MGCRTGSTSGAAWEVSLNCPACLKDNPEGSQFCNHCGKSVQAHAAAATEEPERLIWEGTCAASSLLNLWWFLGFLLVIPILIFLGVAWYRRANRHYRLTSERLTVTSGVFGRSSEDLKLVRVEDININQTFWNLLFKVGDLHLISTDKTEPDLAMRGIPHPEKMKETIWGLVREQRKRMVYMEQLNV